MKNIEIVSKVVSREGEAKHSPSKDISSANLSDYLLKSIWDKVWEIRTDSQGTEYIFCKLPVVTQYGITMYSGDGVDVPSLASGLPFDGRTIWYNPDTQQIEVIGGTGGGSGEGVSNFWDLSGIPSWITNTKPKYTYSEIEGTPDLTKYALASQIPSLSGYATESWVTKQNYATKATTLSGYGITDAYTKTNVDDLLKSYVTIGGTQTITGEKNYTGGLKVNGSPIYYDTEKKYWKFEGDLLVTGGVTMYGSDSSFVPSTIMDAIAVDGTTISKSGGVLKVIGGTGGGVADSVAWANITGKPTWIGSSKPTYTYSEITGAISITELQNYLTQNSYLNVTSGDNRYLKLSGGTINSSFGGLEIKRNNDYASAVKYSNTSGVLGYIGFNDNFNPMLWDKSKGGLGVILHSGNYSSYALPLSGGEISGTLTISPTNISGFQSGLILKDNGYGGNEALKIVWASTNYTNENWLAANPSTSELLFNNYYVWHSGNFTPSNYLPLSGGTMTGPIQVGSYTSFGVAGENFYLGSPSYPLLIRSNGDAKLNGNTIWHSGNDGSGSGLDADLLDGKHDGELTAQYFNKGKILTSSDTINKLMSGVYCYINGNNPIGSVGNNTILLSFRTEARTDMFQLANSANEHSLHYRSAANIGNSYENWSSWRTIAFTDSNVASATKLENNDSYTAWGQTFFINGKPNNIYGTAYFPNGDLIYAKDEGGANQYILGFTSSLGLGYGSAGAGYDTYILGNNIHFRYSTSHITGFTLNSSGNVGIGTTNPSEKLHVDGSVIFEGSNKYLILNRKSSDGGILFKHNGTNKWQVVNYDNGLNFYDYLRQITALIIGTDGVMKFDGNILATGGITMYSMRKLKKVVDERGLSLSELSVIKPTRYTWKDGRDNRLHFGGIADDIQQVLPEVVYSTSDGILTMDYGNAAFAVASSLIQPVVDHEKRIAMLEEENKQLRQEVERLKSA